MVGSPPENCTDIWRRGLIFSALSRISLTSSPLRIFSRASLTHPGHSESVSRGHPSGGLVFCQDFRSGLSDHLGVKGGLAPYLLKNWTASKPTPAVNTNAWSKYFISR